MLALVSKCDPEGRQDPKDSKNLRLRSLSGYQFFANGARWPGSSICCTKNRVEKNFSLSLTVLHPKWMYFEFRTLTVFVG